ncbi:OmpA family protein [Pseudomonas tritici]|uniref:OmpA family protein n=1 Tax=Pseudomonas tritici TaxID=2745518 RepID=UPI00387AE755
MNMMKAAAALTACLLMAGCATNPETGNFEITRTGLGLAAGTVGGALVGAALGDGSAVIKGAMIGAAAGGGAGYLWDKRYQAMQAELAATELQVEQARIADGQQVLVISAPSDVFFRAGSSDITPQAYPALSQLAQSMKGQPYKVGITGHTDTSGTPDTNNRLSYDRARSVAAYLTSAGVPYQSLFVRGVGSKEPKADNTTAQGRSDNRRVEIVLSNETPKG